MRQIGSEEIKAIAHWLANRDGIDNVEFHPRFEEYWKEAEDLAETIQRADYAWYAKAKH